MTASKKTLALALALGLIAPLAQAQDTAAPAAEPAAPEAAAPAAPAPETAAPAAAPEAAAPAASAEGPGTLYTAKTVDSWQVQCLRTEDGKDPCEMFQLLKDADGNKVASISVMAFPDNGDAAAGATIATPLETLLSPGLSLQIDTAEPVRMPFHHCDAGSCYANFALTSDQLGRLKKGNAIKMAVVPLYAPDKPVDLQISLKGFTAAYDAIAATAK